MEEETPQQEALDSVHNLELLEQFLLEAPDDIPFENIPTEAVQALEQLLQIATEDFLIENLEPLETPQQAALGNFGFDYLTSMEQPQQAALGNVGFGYLTFMEQYQQAALQNFPIHYLMPWEQPQQAALGNIRVEYFVPPGQFQPAALGNFGFDYLTSMEQPQHLGCNIRGAALGNARVDSLTPMEQPQLAALGNIRVEYFVPPGQFQPVALGNFGFDYLTSMEQPQHLGCNIRGAALGLRVDSLTPMEQPQLAALGNVRVDSLTPMEQPQQAALENARVDSLTPMEQPQQAALENARVDSLTPMEQPQQAALGSARVDSLTPMEQPQHAALQGDLLDYLGFLKKSQQAVSKRVPVENLELLEQSGQAPRLNIGGEYERPLEHVEQPQEATLASVLISLLESLEQTQRTASEDVSTEHLGQSEQPRMTAVENVPTNRIEDLERYLREVSNNTSLENFVPFEQFPSLGSLESIQTPAEEISVEVTEAPEQETQACPNDIPARNVGSPENRTETEPSTIFYFLRLIQFFPALNDREEFFGQERIYNYRNQEYLVNKRVPIQLILNDDRSTCISHISGYRSFERRGESWKLSQKDLDLTEIISTRPNKRSKFFRFERDTADNKWVLALSHPFKNQYRGKRFSSLRLGVLANYLRDNNSYIKYVNLSKTPVLRFEPVAMDSIQYIFHLTTFDIQLEKKKDKLFFQRRNDDGEIDYSVLNRPARSFTPNCFTPSLARNEFSSD